MCFICSCKKIFHEGLDKFGNLTRKGMISYWSGFKLRQILTGGDEGSCAVDWQYNLSAKHFKDRFGQAVESAPDLQDDVWEWRRYVFCKDGRREILCCPEDVQRGHTCRHAENVVCTKCNVPICHECYKLSSEKRKIPRALANDNFIGYVRDFIVRRKVTWLEATIACPVFTGLVTYYVEGTAADRGHMMREALGRPQRAWGVRGNIFSSLLPWDEVMANLSKCFLTGDFTD